MNTEQYRERLGELRRNWEEPTYRRGSPEWIDVRTGEPREESTALSCKGYTVQLKAKKDLVIGYVNRWAILTKGSVVERYGYGTYGAKYYIVSGEMWTRREEGEPYLVKPYRMDYHEDGSVNRGRVGRRMANWFIHSFSLCGYRNTYPEDDGLFHTSMWEIQYLHTTLVADTGADSWSKELQSERTWGTRVYTDLIHPECEEQLKV